MRLNYYSFGRNPPSLRALSRQLQRYTLLTTCHCDIKSPAVVKFFSTRSMKLLSQCDYHSGCARLHLPAGHLHSRKACLHCDITKSGRAMRAPTHYSTSSLASWLFQSLFVHLNPKRYRFAVNVPFLRISAHYAGYYCIG